MNFASKRHSRKQSVMDKASNGGGDQSQRTNNLHEQVVSDEEQPMSLNVEPVNQ